MTPLISRFTLRLLVPAFALGVLALFADPLPPSTRLDTHAAIEIDIPADERPAGFAVVLQQEAEALRLEAEAAKQAARQTAAQMRWFLTLPAASSKRCSAPTCAS